MLQQLINFSNNIKSNFFMPGHKCGRGLSKQFKKNFGKIDLTEFNETDDLHCPSGIIKEAQQFVAEIFNVRHSRFLVNGTTSGIIAGILSTTTQDDKIIVSRNCHKSVINGIILSGAIPVFLPYNFIKDYEVFECIDPKDIENTILKNPGAKAVLITSPTYFGICSDCEEIFNITQKYKIPLIIDGAHSSHFVFDKNFPKSPACYSDICVTSTHKTLPCLTQSSLLHFNSTLISYSELLKNLELIETTSPSYVLMTSIYEGIKFANNNKKKFSELIKQCNKLREKIKNTKIKCLKQHDCDVTRLVFNFSKFEIDVSEIALYLELKFGIKFEMIFRQNLVGITSISNTKKDLNNLEKALLNVEENFFKTSNKTLKFDINFLDIKIEMNPKKAFNAKKETVKIENSISKISGQTVTLYPPGIPIIIPGQLVSSSIIEFIKNQKIIKDIKIIK